MLPLPDPDRPHPDYASKRAGTRPDSPPPLPNVPPPLPNAIHQPAASGRGISGASSAGPPVTAETSHRRNSSGRGAGRGRTKKSPVVESGKIILGSIGGLLIGYCVLVYGFRIDIFGTHSGQKPADSERTARRSVASKTEAREAETNTMSQAALAADQRHSPSPALPTTPRHGAVASDRVRVAAAASVVQSEPDAQSQPEQSLSEEPSVELVEQGMDEAGSPDLSALGLTLGTPDKSVAESAPARRQPAVEKEVLATKLAVERKASVPDAQAQIAAQKLASEIYAGSFREAKTAADRIAVATEMVEAALKVPDGSSDQYVLLKTARDIAANSGDVEAALRAAEELAERFDVGTVTMQAETLVTAAGQATAATQCKAVAERAASVIEDLAKEDQYELALSLCKAAEGAARKAEESELVRKLSDMMTGLHGQRERFGRYQQALTALEKEPTDPVANQAAGSYLCFVKGDWERGLAMLALGNSPDFKNVAIIDLRGANSPEDQVAVGDAWWALVEKNEGPERDALRLRAEFWYLKAAPNLPEGLAKLKVKHRLEELSNLGGQISTPTVPVESGGPKLSGERADQVAQLIGEAQAAIDRQDYVEARKKLLRVNQLDEDNPQACFYLGLSAWLVEHNSSDARKYFTGAQKSGQENVACLNNLALVAIRARDVNQAVGYWRKSVDLGSAPEVSHNVGVLFQLTERKRVNLSPAVRAALSERLNSNKVAGEPSHSEARARERPRASDSGGWQFMDFMGESAVPTGWRWPNLMDRTCMQCNGMGSADCPARNCSRGKIRESTFDTIPLPGGHVVRKERIVAVPCDTCDGAGRVSCPFCRDGIDRDF